MQDPADAKVPKSRRTLRIGVGLHFGDDRGIPIIQVLSPVEHPGTNDTCVARNKQWMKRRVALLAIIKDDQDRAASRGVSYGGLNARGKYSASCFLSFLHRPPSHLCIPVDSCCEIDLPGSYLSVQNARCS